MLKFGKLSPNCNFIPPVMCAEDLSYVDSKELITFFEQLGNMFGYEMIVVDISTAVRQPWDMLDMCSTVYIPEKSDYISKEKLKCFETYYSSIGREYSFDRFELIRLPEGENDMKPDFWEKCGYSGMCRYVRKMLEKVGDNCYQTTLNSGDFDGIGVEISGDGSSIASGQLEMSNVDLSSQFTDMIVTQRGFQANSRVITTSDTLLEELINLKR